MNAPTACWQAFPFLDHRTCEEVERDHVEAAVSGASSIGWHRRQDQIEHRAALQAPGVPGPSSVSGPGSFSEVRG